MSQVKVCVVCNADCAGKPRVKDPKGRYYCKPCYDRKAAERAGAPMLDLGSPAPPPPVEPAPDDELADIFGMAAEASVAPPIALSCPKCHAGMDAGAVFCVQCGHDLRSGHAAKTRVQRAPKGPPVTSNEMSTLFASGWTLGLGNLAVLIAFVTVLCDAINGGMARAGTRPTASWGMILVSSFVAACIGTVIWWFLGPWWYRVRVQWAGGDADTDSIRSPYFATILPLTIFSAVSVIVTIMSHSSPFEYMQADWATWDTLESVIGLALLLFATVWLFLIVRRAFGVRLVPGILLLVVLPLVWYLAVFIAVIVMMTAVAIADPAAFGRATGISPITSSPRQYVPAEGYPFTFDYPANWVTSYGESDPSDPEMPRELLVEGPDGTNVTLFHFPFEIEFDAAADETMAGLRDLGFAVTPVRDIDSLEKFRGTGRELLLRSPEGDGRATLFTFPTREGAVWVQVIVNDPDHLDGYAGVRQILRSLIVR